MSEILVGLRLTATENGMMGVIEGIVELGKESEKTTGKQALLANTQKRLGQEIDKTKGELDQQSGTQKRLGNETDKTKRKLDQQSDTQKRLGKQSDNTADDLDQLSDSQQRLGRETDKTNKKLNNHKERTKKAGKSMGMMRGATTQLGYQLQDMAVQLQMGVNPMVVLTQQGSQLASVFGPTGAMVGAVLAIGGAIAGPMVSAFMRGEEAIDGFEGRFESMVDNLHHVQVRNAEADINALRDLILDLEGDLDESLEGPKKSRSNAGDDERLAKNRQDQIDKTQELTDARLALAAAEQELEQLRNGDDENQRINNVQKYIAELERERDTLGMTNIELAVYKAQQLEMTPAQIENVRLLAEKIELRERELEQESRAERANQAAAQREANAARTEHNRLMSEGAALTRSLLNPTELYEARIERINKLLEANAINEDTATRARTKAWAEINGMADDAEEAFDRMQQASDRAAGAFEDAWVDSVKNAELSLSSFVDTIIDELLRINYEQYLQQPVQKIMDSAFGTTSSTYSTDTGSQQTQQIIDQNSGLTPAGRAAPAPEAIDAAFSATPSIDNTGSLLSQQIINQIDGLTPAGRAASVTAAPAPAAPTVVINNHNDLRGVNASDRALIEQRMAEIGRQQQQELQRQLNNGGSMARATGRRA